MHDHHDQHPALDLNQNLGHHEQHSRRAQAQSRRVQSQSCAVIASATPRSEPAASIAEASTVGIETAPARVKTFLPTIAVHGVEKLRRQQGCSSLTPFLG
jgi:hypothetical protein